MKKVLILLFVFLSGCSGPTALLSSAGRLDLPKSDKFYIVEASYLIEGISFSLTMPLQCTPEDVYRGAWHTKWVTQPRIFTATSTGNGVLVTYAVPCSYLENQIPSEYCPSVVYKNSAGELKSFSDKRTFSAAQNKHLKNCPIIVTVNGVKEVDKVSFNKATENINPNKNEELIQRLETYGQTYYEGAYGFEF